VLSLIVIYFGGFRRRLAVLLFNLVVGGIILNAQYSSEQIATILSGHSPSAGLTGAFLLVAGIPVLVIVFGNIYCGYLCPFGAAQELLGYIIPARFKELLSKEKMQKARFIKYAVAFVLLIAFFLSGDRTTLTAEPLISVFNLRFTMFDFHSSLLLIAAIALIGAVFYTRFWCKYLCPVGAFLSLLNNIAVLNRYLPAKRFGRCEFGLTPKDRTDCIYCDRCRYIKEQPAKIAAEPPKALSRYFITGVLIAAVLVSAISLNRFSQVIGAGYQEPPVSISAGGRPRDLDLQRIRQMIEQGRLSNREAQFYKKIEKP
jgi:polyferredoxin